MSTANSKRREQADQAFVRSLGDISSPDQDDLDLIACERIKWHEAVQWADSTPAPSEQGEEEMNPDELIPRSEADRLVREAVERLKNDVKRYSEMSLQYMSQIQELRSLLERAKGFADLVFGYNTTNGINPKYELEWLSDYAKLTSNAAQGERDDK